MSACIMRTRERESETYRNLVDLCNSHVITQSPEPGSRGALSSTGVLQSFTVKLVEEPDFDSLVECEFVSEVPASLLLAARATDTVGHPLLHAIEA